jgi:hypothetical protein
MIGDGVFKSLEEVPSIGTSLHIFTLLQAYGVTTKAGGPRELVIEYCDQPNWGPHYFRPT